MAQPSRKREQAVLQLEQLAPLCEWPKCNAKGTQHAYPELEYIGKLWSQGISGVEAVGAQQVDKVS